MIPSDIDHPRYPDYDSAAVGAAVLKTMLPNLEVNIHPFGVEQADGALYQLSVSDKQA
jgi:hypothetical protein